MENDNYAHEIKDIMSFKEDDYEILLYFNFINIVSREKIGHYPYFFNKLINYIVIHGNLLSCDDHYP